MTHCELIINHLRNRGSITPGEAMLEYGIMRLAPRVQELRRFGSYKIETEMHRSVSGASYARYLFTGVDDTGTGEWVRGVRA